MKFISYVFIFFIFAVKVLDAIDFLDVHLQENQLSAHAARGPLFVSLGSSCEVAHQLYHLKLRVAAFPLDWILSIDNSQLIKMLNEDFANFDYEEHLILKRLGINNTVLLNTHYSLVIPHEGNWEEPFYLETLEKFKSKYQRRINRFREINSFPGKVFFIRAAWPYANDPSTIYRDEGNLEISDEYTVELYEVLKNRFPDVDFTLIITNISHGEEVLIRKLSNNIIKVHHNPFLQPVPRLDLCKRTFIKLLEDCDCSETQIFQDLLNANPSFP